jgi:hypothetical protein
MRIDKSSRSHFAGWNSLNIEILKALEFKIEIKSVLNENNDLNQNNNLITQNKKAKQRGRCKLCKLTINKDNKYSKKCDKCNEFFCSDHLEMLITSLCKSCIIDD